MRDMWRLNKYWILDIVFEGAIVSAELWHRRVTIKLIIKFNHSNGFLPPQERQKQEMKFNIITYKHGENFDFWR